jgi:hypothetical protein
VGANSRFRSFFADGASPNFKVFNDEVLFTGTDINGNEGLWVTDGTAGGMHELAVNAAYAGGLFFDGLSPDFAVVNGLPNMLTPPTVAVSINNTDVNVAHGTGTVTFTFSEAPTAFTLAGTGAVGGTLSNLQQVNATTFTAAFTGTPDTDISNASVSVTTMSAARSFTGIAQRLHIRWIDVSKIYRVLTGHPGHGPRETRRIVKLERAGVGGGRISEESYAGKSRGF